MAKSKSGGTRSYIRGRIASDVYSVGKDAKGKKQQVVRSLAEVVSNPQTQAQMIGRMLMSTTMQAVSALSQLVNHSFDGVAAGQPSISQFIKENYALLKADYAAHPSSDNVFGISNYGEKGMKMGAYIIANGKAAIVSTLDVTAQVANWAGWVAGKTVAEIKEAFGMSNDDYLTSVALDESGELVFTRFRFNPALADTTVIAAGNISQLFLTEGNNTGEISASDNGLVVQTKTSLPCAGAVIVSYKTADGYIHNKAVMATQPSSADDAMKRPGATALATYPQGSAAYLNGGDVQGMTNGQESDYSEGGGD